jgi:hypothetical protein
LDNSSPTRKSVSLKNTSSSHQSPDRYLILDIDETLVSSTRDRKPLGAKSSDTNIKRIDVFLGNQEVTVGFC